MRVTSSVTIKSPAERRMAHGNLHRILQVRWHSFERAESLRRSRSFRHIYLGDRDFKGRFTMNNKTMKTVTQVAGFALAISLMTGCASQASDELSASSGSAGGGGEMLRVPAESPNSPELNKALEVVGEISEKFPEEYALAYVVDDKSIVLGFREAAPAGAIEMIEAVESNVKVEENFAISEAEIQQQIGKVGELVTNFAGEGVGVEVAFIAQDFKLEVVFSGVPEVPKGTEALSAEIAKITPLPIEFQSTAAIAEAR